MTDPSISPQAAQLPAAVSEKAFDEHLEKLRTYYADTMDRGQRYTGFIIAAGFAAFFTIWGTFRPLMPAWAVLLTGSLIGASLIFFIGFEIWKAQMMTAQSTRMSKALLEATPATFDAVIAAEAKSTREYLIAARIWPWVFYPTAILGMAAAVLLVLFGLADSAGLLPK